MRRSGSVAGLWGRIGRRARTWLRPTAAVTSQEFWSRYNVTDHRVFRSAEESLQYFRWRTSQYYDYLDMMPVAGQAGTVVLDYGCGPGHDLVGFATASRPSRLIGMDVSGPSLAEAERRLGLHGAKAELIKIDEGEERLPLPTASVDYIHSSGVLHHVPDPLRVLREFQRVLKPSGTARIMVYNYDSIWLHLFAAYVVRFTDPSGRGLDVREAFKRSTDTSDCPISQAWSAGEVARLCHGAGLACEHLGNAVSVREIAILPQRYPAILSVDLEEEHRQFLLDLTFDRRGVPYYRDQAAGIDGCYRLTGRR